MISLLTPPTTLSRVFLKNIFGWSHLDANLWQKLSSFSLSDYFVKKIKNNWNSNDTSIMLLKKQFPEYCHVQYDWYFWLVRNYVMNISISSTFLDDWLAFISLRVSITPCIFYQYISIPHVLISFQQLFETLDKLSRNHCIDYFFLHSVVVCNRMANDRQSYKSVLISLVYFLVEAIN